jgi:hypothetical protein
VGATDEEEEEKEEEDIRSVHLPISVSAKKRR